MSNPIDFTLDVLAANPDEINHVEAALQEPCDELLCWGAEREQERPEEIAGAVKSTVCFKPVCNLGYVDPSVNQARRFRNWSNDHFWGTVMRHIYLVSIRFPTTIFLLEYCDTLRSFAGKTVIRAGEDIQQVYDGRQQSQVCEWTMPNVFAPFLAEYWNGWKFGSLWDRWVRELVASVHQLQPMTGACEAGATLATETVEASSGQRWVQLSLPFPDDSEQTEEVPDDEARTCPQPRRVVGQS